MTDLDHVRKEALDRVDRAERGFKMFLFAAAFTELAFLVAMMVLTNFDDRGQLLLFVSSIAVYTIVVFAVAALGAYLNRQILRVLQAVTLLAPRS